MRHVFSRMGKGHGGVMGKKRAMVDLQEMPYFPTIPTGIYLSDNL